MRALYVGLRGRVSHDGFFALVYFLLWIDHAFRCIEQVGPKQAVCDLGQLLGWLAATAYFAGFSWHTGGSLGWNSRCEIQPKVTTISEEHVTTETDETSLITGCASDANPPTSGK
jgi:hypothetical protein